MVITDKKIFNLKYFAEAYAIKQKIEFNRKHEEARIRAFHEQDVIAEKRKIAAEEIEVLKIRNLLAMQNEIDQRIESIKRKLNLNII